MQVIGWMLKLMHFEQCVRNAEIRSKIVDVGRVLEIEVIKGHLERI